jgi:hypothetical protein
MNRDTIHLGPYEQTLEIIIKALFFKENSIRSVSSLV